MGPSMPEKNSAYRVFLSGGKELLGSAVNGAKLRRVWDTDGAPKAQKDYSLG